jgi:hypothetical protein
VRVHVPVGISLRQDQAPALFARSRRHPPLRLAHRVGRRALVPRLDGERGVSQGARVRQGRRAAGRAAPLPRLGGRGHGPLAQRTTSSGSRDRMRRASACRCTSEGPS